MEENNSSQRSLTVLKMEANKSEKPYFNMIIIGGVLFVVSIILFIASGVVLGLSSAKTAIEALDSLDLDNLDIYSFLPTIILYGIGWLTLLASFGLLGPGIPLFIVTKVRKKRALSELEKMGM